jgi:feruloyl esterase
MTASRAFPAIVAIFLTLAFAPRLAAQADPAQAGPAKSAPPGTDLATCAGLVAQTLPSTTINSAEAVTAGSFTPPGSTNAQGDLPPFCRVAGVISFCGVRHIEFTFRGRSCRGSSTLIRTIS